MTPLVSALVAIVTIDVTTTDDVVADDGVCSLREALASARDDVSSGSLSGECPAGESGLDTITVPAGTYVLTGELLADSQVRLEGAGEGDTVIDAAGLGRAFHVTADAQFHDMTLQNGSLDSAVGGSLLVESATLVVTNVTLTGNSVTTAGSAVAPQGGGIAAYDATTFLTGVTISDMNLEGSSSRWTEGGAIYVEGGFLDASFLTMEDISCGASGRGSEGCGLYADEAEVALHDVVGRRLDTGSQQIQYGGALYLSDTTYLVERAAFYDNVDSGYGVVVASDGSGTLRNTTIAENTGDAEVGLFLVGGPHVVDHVTVVNNPMYGLVTDTATVQLHASTFAGHGDGDCYDDGGSSVTLDGTTVVSSSFGDDCELFGTPTEATLGFEPLSTEGDYLATVAPSDGSALVGASTCLDADGAALATDARGLPRPGTGCTSGAYEVLVCGDGNLDDGEACDDGNTEGDDGCSATCEVEENWLCAEVLPSVCVALDADGDGWTDAEETWCGSDPFAQGSVPSDLDGDGICDTLDLDADGDGADAVAEALCGTSDTDATSVPLDEDLDGDGFFTCEDCDDTDASIAPDAFELVGDGVDQDCDGYEVCYVDMDRDEARTTEQVVDDDLTCKSSGLAPADAPLDCTDDDATANQYDTDGDGWSTCAGDEDDDDAGVIGDGLRLSDASVPLAGWRARFRVTGADAGARLQLLRGVAGGTTSWSACGVDVPLGDAQPTKRGQAAADGSATLALTLPTAAAEGALVVVDLDACAVSNVVTQHIYAQ